MRYPIAFGTDGWRALIGEGFTIENLERVTAATIAWLRTSQEGDLTVVVGYDTRFGGERFATHVARQLADAGISVILSDGVCPTPAVSWVAKARKASVGIMITASHNPPDYNGFKLKGSFGGSATPAMIAEVESWLGRVEALPEPPSPLSVHVDSGQIVLEDIRNEHMEGMASTLNLDAIRAAGFKVAHDAMFGAAQGVVASLLAPGQTINVRHGINPGFEGTPPEPIEKNMGPLVDCLASNSVGLAIANDGDADRIAMYDERGGYVSSHLILCLLLRYLVEFRHKKGLVVKTYSATEMLAKMASHYGLECVTTPIGFKHVTDYFLQEDVLVGGEESGGIAVAGHIPERDGIYIGLLIAEMVAVTSKPLSQLVEDLFSDFGPHYHHRIDFHTTEAVKNDILNGLSRRSLLTSIGGRPVSHVWDLDGFKHFVSTGWLLVRASGTEPVLRVYSEGNTPAEAKALVQDAATAMGLFANQ